MYFPKLFELVFSKQQNFYTAEIISKIDDYLGTLKEGTSFNEESLNFFINNIQLTDKILDDLINLGLIEREELDLDEDIENPRYNFVLLVNPNKVEDSKYLDYISKKRQIDSFSIIYEKTKAKQAGALVLVDLKGYSKNVNNKENNAAVLLLVQHLQDVIDECIKPYFLNSYNGIEIKHNGDGWFLYFIKEDDAYNFLETVIISCKSNQSIRNSFKSLGTTLKCYIHHAKEIEKIYKVDTLHFDMEGKDVILIHMLEKPIEKRLYEGIISQNSNFIAITEGVLDKIDSNSQKTFKELKDVVFNIKDSEGNLKMHQPDIKIFYKEF